jgi:hypothetical protein
VCHCSVSSVLVGRREATADTAVAHGTASDTQRRPSVEFAKSPERRKSVRFIPGLGAFGQDPG